MTFGPGGSARPPGTVDRMERPIEASTIIAATAARVEGLLLGDPTVALANPIRLAFGGVHRDVVVTVDDPEVAADRVVIHVAWHAAEHAGLFPTFLGALETEPSVGGTRLSLSGRYRVPLGTLGRFGDGLVGRRVAHDAVRNVLAGIAARVSSALGVDGDERVVVAELPADAHIG